MPRSEFALPSTRDKGKGGYPIPDESHARNALQRVSEFGSPSEKAEVREKVHAKFPGIKIGGKGGSLRRAAERARGR